MVIYENYGTNSKGVELVKAYSSENLYITRDGVMYEEAIDPRDANRQYEETNAHIIDYTEEEYAEAGRILLGVDE